MRFGSAVPATFSTIGQLQSLSGHDSIHAPIVYGGGLFIIRRKHKEIVMDGGCVLCNDHDQQVLWRDELCRVIWVDEPDYPGFCRVILNRHVAEMTDLPAQERNWLMEVVFAVESTVRDTLDPDKINLASLGNMVPHVHWHVIPRWRTDRHFPGSIWSAPQNDNPHLPVNADMIERLKQRIQQLAP
jgi:diadenosine tetraphosphate (Ap4A) HIT family hydrolase